MREASANFRGVIDSVPTGVLIHRRGRVLYANPSFCAALGFDPAGRDVEDLVAADGREAIASVLAPNADAARRLPRVEVPFRRADGAVVLLELAPSQPVEFDGEAGVLVGHDVTERREMQVKSQLADRMASIGTIAAGVAHEINNPLTYVIDNVRRIGELASTASGGSRSELRELVGEAVSGLERVELIVRDLKMFSRADGDAVSAVDVRDVIESTARIAASQIRSRAQLTLDLAEIPKTAGHPTRLGQVILNLLLNAAQAIPEGAPDRNRIDVVARSQGGVTVIEVKDTGSGIRPEHLTRIFEPFVTSMGGTVAVESRLGEGTTIRVTLPVTTPPAATPPAVEPRVVREAIRKRILVVDDEPLVARALQRALRAHDVTVALGGREALDVLRADAFDVIVCDLMMPGVSGIDLYEQLPGELRRRFVFATGGAFNQRAQQFLAEVPNQRIDKPFDPKLVAKMVDEFQPLDAR